MLGSARDILWNFPPKNSARSSQDSIWPLHCDQRGLCLGGKPAARWVQMPVSASIRAALLRECH